MTKVFLREKKLKHGKRGLYLDFYPPIVNEATGKETRRDHLSLYVYEKPKNDTERDHNKETRILAESVRSKRQLDLQAGVFGFVYERNKRKDFLDYFRSLTEAKRRASSKSNYETWVSVLKYLKQFSGGQLTFGQVTESLCRDFKSYLLGKCGLSNNTAAQYFDKFKASVREAADAGLLPANHPAKRVKSIKAEDVQREFLTFEELLRLSRTPFGYENLRRAALLSALTGLRYSDIAKLTWKEIHRDGDECYIRFRQKKTGSAETLPISTEAAELLGETFDGDELVFRELQYWQCGYLKEWTDAAGIDKRVTFHCFRHTFATLQLTFGTDIYTVSKMLGHKNLQTTQIYARVIDQKKREAATRISLKGPTDANGA